MIQSLENFTLKIFYNIYNKIIKMKKITKILIGIGLVIAGVILWKNCSTSNNFPPDPTFGNTGFEVVNSTKDSVQMFLTINSPADSTWVQSVDGIFGIPVGSGLQGSVWLKPNDTLSYTPTLQFSGNVSFGTGPQNCPSKSWPTGVNIFEWSTNVPKGANEGLDLSCIAGVNCIMHIDLIGGPDWLANDTSVRTIENKAFMNNTGIYGVFPYGCTNCTNTDGKQDCQTPSETPNTEKICTPTRAADQKGGKIRITFKGYFEPAE